MTKPSLSLSQNVAPIIMTTGTGKDGSGNCEYVGLCAGMATVGFDS